MGLHEYSKKRDFSKTDEPKAKKSNKNTHVFVIQQHAASHLHYDFRLELHGVLKSWAIPKGPSLDPNVKRLAIHVEDHPLAYGNFEGIIPKEQYGGGTVMLWDKGTWEPLDSDPNKAYEQGHLRFHLSGKKLKGRWDLIRLHQEKQWFLIKYQDDNARLQQDYDILKEKTKSVASQLSLQGIAKKKSTPSIVLPKKLPLGQFSERIAPQLSFLVDEPPTGTQWLHEVKWDGYRILAYKNKKKVVLKSRNNKDWTKRLRPVTLAIQQVPFDRLILDGEVVILDHKGRSDFQLLQQGLKSADPQFVYSVFDLLYFDHYDLRSLTLIERKTVLKQIVAFDIPILTYGDHIIGHGEAMLAHCYRHGLEGMISKQVDSTYSGHRSRDWLKIKCLRRQEFIIAGYTKPKGGRTYFGSLLLGVYNKAGTLDFVGKVGTGFNKATLKEIYTQLTAIKSTKNPFQIMPPDAKNAYWVRPQLICDVLFTEWTKKGLVRHPSFKGMRHDKMPKEVVRENANPRASKRSTITHPNKKLYPEDNISKEDLLAYYQFVSDFILPFIRLRPLTLLRCPSNYHSCFYQRHPNKTTSATLFPISIEHSSTVEPYIYLKDKNGLMSLVQMGVLEIHPWGSSISDLEKPDILVFDLDPDEKLTWSYVVDAAFEVKDYLHQYQLQSFVKTTGGKGLHIMVPILPEHDWFQIKQFTHGFAQVLEKLHPKKYVSTMARSKRQGKIFIDYLRNQHASSAIAAYSTRALPGAPVATPLTWEELSQSTEKPHFTIKTLPQRLKQLKEDPWKDFWQIKQSLII